MWSTHDRPPSAELITSPSTDAHQLPYALTALPGQADRLLVALRGGAMLVTGDAGETWSGLQPGLPDVIALAAAPA